MEIDEEKLTETKLGKEILELLNSPLRNHLADLKEDMEKAIDSVKNT